MRAQEYGYQTSELWTDANSVPTESIEDIPKFNSTKAGVGYLTDFVCRTLPAIKVPRGIDFLELDIKGKIAPKAFPSAIFAIVAAHFQRLASFQNLRIEASFERKGASQSREYCSSVYLFSRDRLTKAYVTYYGGGVGDEVPLVGWEIAGLMAQTGFPMRIEDGSLQHQSGGKVQISHWQMFCEIEGITTERIQQMEAVFRTLCSKIYGYSWSIGTVDEEIAKPRGFEMIDTVSELGLTADEYKITARYRFTSKLGWDVIRDCCGEGERLHHFIGTYSEKRQKITLCVATKASGHRLCLFSRQPISEAQLAQADATLGVHFNREPFVWPGKREQTE